MVNIHSAAGVQPRCRGHKEMHKTNYDVQGEDQRDMKPVQWLCDGPKQVNYGAQGGQCGEARHRGQHLLDLQEPWISEHTFLYTTYICVLMPILSSTYESFSDAVFGALHRTAAYYRNVIRDSLS